MDNKILIKALRSSARQLGLGKALGQIRMLKTLTLKGAFEMSLGKRRYLTRITEAQPIAAGEGAIEVHMLLHHKRIYEGLWALYSFAYFCAQPCRIVVHNDGSLTDVDVALLKKLFLQCKVIDRQTSDSVVYNYFHRKGMVKCAELRQKYVHVMKLFDPLFFSDNQSFISLDSDVLFFSSPQELIDEIGDKDNIYKPLNLYSIDIGISSTYSLQETELATLLGKNCIEKLNAGVLKVCRDNMDFKRIEQYLQHSHFWNPDGMPNYYTEQTLWAMEFTTSNSLPLPNTYAICPTTDEPNLVSGHYCGGGYWGSLFYARGLPRLAASFL